MSCICQLIIVKYFVHIKSQNIKRNYTQNIKHNYTQNIKPNIHKIYNLILYHVSKNTIILKFKKN